MGRICGRIESVLVSDEGKSLPECNKFGPWRDGTKIWAKISRERDAGLESSRSWLSRDSKAHLHCVTELFSTTATLYVLYSRHALHVVIP